MVQIEMNSSQIPPLAPGTKPLFGHLFQFKKDPLAFFATHACQMGQLYRIKLLQKEYVVVNHPDAIRHILVNNVKKYSRRKSYAFLQELLGDGLLTSEGEAWRKQRRLSQPAFSKEQLHGLITQMDQSIQDYLKDNWKDNSSIDLEKSMNVLTLQILTQSILYSPSQSYFQQVQYDLHDALQYMTSSRFNAIKVLAKLPSEKKRKGKEAIKNVKALVSKIIAERADPNSDKYNDLLEMLMSTKDEETGESLGQDALLDEVMTMFVAGHDTTAAALTWTIYLLHKNNQALNQMYEELNSQWDGKEISFQTLNALPYMKMIIQEALRLLPPVWAFGRKAKEEDSILGYELQKGQSVNIPIYAIHRHPDFWEKPNEFYPEHFLPEAVKQRDKFAYMPFSLGQHRCIGEYFAIMEIQMVLMRVYKNFSIELTHQEPLEFIPLVTLKPKHAIQLRIKKI
jgi:cytochrome P450